MNRRIMNRPIRITDDAGRTPIPREQITEPNRDSVMLSDGPHGMAWQRYGDGLWYPIRSRKGRTWDEMLDNCRNLVLVYDAPKRPTPQDRDSPVGRSEDALPVPN